MDNHQRRVADRASGLVGAGRPVAVVVPPGWGARTQLDVLALRPHTRLVTDLDAVTADHAITLVDGISAPPLVLETIARRAVEERLPVIVVTSHPCVAWPGEVTVIAPPDVGVQAADLDPSLAESASDTLLTALAAGAGNPALIDAVTDLLPSDPSGAEQLAARPETNAALVTHVEDAWSLLSPREHLLAALLTTVPGLRRRDAELVVPGVGQVWDRLRRSGLVVTDAGTLRLCTLAQTVLDGRLHLDVDELQPDRLQALVDGLSRSGHHGQLLDLLRVVDDPDLTRRRLKEMWDETRLRDLLHSPRRGALLERLDALLRGASTADRCWLLEARAVARFYDGQLTGSWEDLAAVRPLHPDPTSIDLLAARTAHYLGDYHLVLEAAERVVSGASDERVTLTDGEWAVRQAQAHAWLAQAAFNRSELEEADREADRCEQLLARLPGAQATLTRGYLHLARSLIAFARGERALNAREQGLALGYAQAAGDDDVVVLRIRENQAAAAVEEGRLDLAVTRAQEVLALQEAWSLTAFSAMPLHTLGEALRNQGDLDSAVAVLEDSRDVALATGSANLVFPAVELALCRIYRGERVRARADLDQAMRLPLTMSRYRRDLLTGGRMMLELFSEDLTAALELSASLADSVNDRWRVLAAAVGSLCASLLGHGDAGERAAGAVEDAIRAHDDHGRAVCRAVALLLQSPPAPDEALAELETMREAGFLLEADVWTLLLDPLIDGPAAQRRVAAARAVLAERGVHHVPRLVPQLGAGGADLEPAVASAAGEDGVDGAGADASRAASPADGAGRVTQRSLLSVAGPVTESSAAPELSIGLLGRFTVERDGVVVPSSAFGSRKARHLLQLLSARWGESLSRDQLGDLLWDDGGTPQRLRVLISEVRAALDPEKRYAPGTFVGSDARSVWLEPEHVEVDSARFLTAAAEGRRRASEGDLEASQAAYERAAELFRGEPAVDDSTMLLTEYVEHLRVTAGDVHRALARLARDQRRYAAAVSWWLRVLATDPYDEAAHLGLVRTLLRQGRSGEAQRAYRRYCDRMSEIGVRAAAFPSQVVA